jgi:site-specific DNA-methyltransferase (adenine-specific)
LKPYFQNKGITIFNADCVSAMKEMEDKAFDLAIVDPPYREDNQPDQWLRAHGSKKTFTPPAPEYWRQLRRTSNDQIVWGGNYFTYDLYANNNWIIWHKLNEGVHFSMCEMAWCSIRKNIQLFKHPPDKSKIHPTQKPVALYRWLLSKYAKPGNTILDTHLGSGSIAIACHDLGFTLTAYEIDEEYCEAAAERISRHQNQEVLNFGGN